MNGLDGLAADYSDAAAALLDDVGPTCRAVLGTLGPAGTSSHHAVDHLRARLAEHGRTDPFEVKLYDSFDDVLADLVGERLDYALVPSAYRDTTAFHWHPALRLAFHFAHPTPAYGLAARPAEAFAGAPAVRVASVPEVRNLYAGMCPPALRDRAVQWLDAGSTVDAAALLARGATDLAITNENGRARYTLDWLSYRPGAHIVWLLFAATREHSTEKGRTR